MAIVCCVCGKKQSGWIQDEALRPEMPDYRICGTCSDHKKKLLSYAGKEKDKFEEEKGYFISCMNDKEMDPQVLDCLQGLIDTAEEQWLDDDERRRIQEERRKLTEERSKLQAEEQRKKDFFLMTTGYNFEGYTIKEYKGVVASEVVMGTGFMKQFSAGFSDVFGVEAGGIGEKLEEGRDEAVKRLIEKVKDFNANALIGVSFEYSTIGTVAVIAVSGTAVLTE
ncbi:YbjQ family protein [Anaerolentibacter hominis]|uniref:YbjQ family protein n=1 Tax=Anaerolentibacter hominis TaxID=3079009 RepID=UPI0031B85981